jgi:hypothetical protein
MSRRPLTIRRLLRFREGGHVLQHGLGFSVLRDDQGLALFGKAVARFDV